MVLSQFIYFALVCQGNTSPNIPFAINYHNLMRFLDYYNWNVSFNLKGWCYQISTRWWWVHTGCCQTPKISLDYYN